MALEVFDLVCPLEIAGIHHADLHKDEVAKDTGEHPQHRKEGVQPQAIEAAHQQHRQKSVYEFHIHIRFRYLQSGWRAIRGPAPSGNRRKLRLIKYR